MVEILMESGGQERVVSKSGQSSPKISQISSSGDNVDLSPIQQFYNGQNILLTGGTGFLGKLLVEKLLRTCPGINVIYLLVRTKKGKDMHQRTEELFDDPLFSKLKEEHPKFRHQVVAIAGDCEMPGLGISNADKATLINEVSIVFHVAATVRFDEKLKLAVSINVRAPREVICLCKQMRQLKSFIHVSTAYSNCPENFIDEKFYEPPIDGNKLITLMECMDEKMMDDITPMLLGRWPNTYTFTKAVAEDIVKNEAQNLPVGIFRPAIVISTYKEPIRGWIDNMYGPTGVAAGAGSGLLRSIHCDGSIEANVVPGDLTVNALICSAWDVANNNKNREKNNSDDIPIYNYVSKDNPITYDQLKEMSAKHGLTIPSIRAVWYYSFRNNKHKIVHLFYVYFLHLLPALLVDTASLCMGKQPRLLKIYKKIHKFMEVLNYFTTKQWQFSNDNVQSIINRMSQRDKNNFMFDVKEIVWDTYFQTYIQGIRIYLIKDPLDTLPQARIKWQRMYWLHQAVKVLFTYALLRVAWIAVSSLLSAIA